MCASSTARLLPLVAPNISDTFEAKEMLDIKENSENDVEVLIEASLKSKLEILNNRLGLLNKKPLRISRTKKSLAEINKEFQLLIDLANDASLTHQEKLVIEEYKLQLMKSVQQDFKQRYGKKEKKEIEEIKSTSKWRLGLFFLIILFDLIPMAVGSFVGMTSLLSTVPGFTDLLVYGCSAFVSGIEALMFYAVMSPLLKASLGITPEDTTEPLLKTYESKITIAENLNAMMTNELEHTHKALPHSHYKQYALVMNQFNKDIASTKIAEFKEPLYKKVLRSGLSFLNFMLNVSGGYFMANMLLSIVAASLVGTPIGWAIIGIIVAGGLIGRFVVRSNSMFEMLNPRSKRHQEIHKKLEAFEPKDDTIEIILNKKQEHEKLIQAKTKFDALYSPVGEVQSSIKTFPLKRVHRVMDEPEPIQEVFEEKKRRYSI